MNTSSVARLGLNKQLLDIELSELTKVCTVKLQDIFDQFRSGAITFDSMLSQAKQGMYKQVGVVNGRTVQCISPSTAATLNIMWEDGVITEDQKNALFRLASSR